MGRGGRDLIGVALLGSVTHAWERVVPDGGTMKQESIRSEQSSLSLVSLLGLKRKGRNA